MTRKELLDLLVQPEGERLERTISTTDMDKFCEAICAFANDMGGSGKNGYLLVGVHDDGRLSGLKATDALLKNLAAIRSEGNVLPIPAMSVEAFHLDGGDVVAVEVAPAALPPVRYRGRTWIRVGPRKAIATREEEDLLIERRRAKFPTFDSMPCVQAKLEDLDLDLFRHGFLPKAFDEGTLAGETRSVERQMEALCFYSTEYGCPTNAGVVLFGKNPVRFLPGDYIQFVQFAGTTRASDIVNQQTFRGCLMAVLPEIDTFIKTAIAKNRPVPVSVLRERTVFDYPKWSIRELMMNAIMHRDYRSTGPTMFYQFADRLELLNSGGLYGRVNAGNFPDENDYRNPVIADAMRTLGYVNRFGRGIGRVQEELEENGNGEPAFDTGQVGSFRVTVNLTKYAETDFQERVMAQKRKESGQKREENGPESKESTLKRKETSPEKEELLQAWAARVLSLQIRSDARQNMMRALVAVGREPEITTEKLMETLGLSQSGVFKTMSALKKMGLVERIGPDFGGCWELPGFNP
ncbi:MAG: putative DNA binding domain-containing protein [Kiritimatiellae bacterium]|nr:putative DNA binding domain-containing protein [Kiritimatiellia bacterium]